MTKADITNSVLGRVLSLEFLGMVVVMGVSWGTLTARVQGLDGQIEENKRAAMAQISELKLESSNVKNEVVLINRKLDVMGNNQDHFKDQIEGLDDRSVQILEILKHESDKQK